MAAIGEIWAAAFSMKLFEQRMLLTLHYRLGNLGTIVTDNDAYLDLTNALLAVGGVKETLEDAMTADTEIVDVRAQRVFGIRSVLRSTPIGSFGNVVDNAAGPNVAGVITLRTELGGRSQVSNKHIPGIGKAQVANGSLDAAQITRLDNLGVLLRTILLGPTFGGTWAPVIYHSRRVPPGQYDLLTSNTTQTTQRVMRRRTVGVGI